MAQKTCKIKNFLIFVLILFFLFGAFLLFNNFTVKANGETINEIVEEQLENLNLNDLEDFYDNIEEKPDGNGFFDLIKKIVNGRSNSEARNPSLLRPSILKKRG